MRAKKTSAEISADDPLYCFHLLAVYAGDLSDRETDEVIYELR